MPDPITESCRNFIHAVVQAKVAAESRDAFWEDRNAAKAYQQMLKALRDNTPQDLQWQTEVWELAHSYSDHIWENDCIHDDVARRYCNQVHCLLDDLASAEWIACVPIERVFNRFHEFTDFGSFAIVNPLATSPQSSSDLLQGFRRTLVEKFGVTFMPEREVGNSYLRLSEHYHQKSGYYIPGRPQFVLKTGRGERFSNKLLLASKVRRVFDLIALCQIAYEADASLLEAGIIGPESVMPDGTRMVSGLIEIPSVAIAINVRTGEADWWVTGTTAYETESGEAYDPTRFMTYWNDIALPVEHLRTLGLSGKIREALDNAIQIVTKCRHAEMGNLMVYSIIATEAILNPFNVVNDISERFALFSAALTETTANERRETYRTAKHLYQYRCHAVHRGRWGSDTGTVREDSKIAFQLFLRCLKAIGMWATERLSRHEPCNQSAFAELYINSLFA